MSSFTTSSGSNGVTSAGTLSQLIAIGAADSHLTLGASVTYHRTKVQKCTNFAMESIMQSYSGTPQWGNEVQVTLNRTGDLISNMYVLIDLPGLVATPKASGSTANPTGVPTADCKAICEGDLQVVEDEDDMNVDNDCEDATGDWCHWVDEIGFAALERVAFSIGGQIIDAVYSHYLHMWEELSGKPGKRLYEMIGKRYHRAQLIADSKEARRLYVPLNFYFTRHSGNALPLVSLQFHSLQVHVKFAPIAKLIQRSAPHIQVDNKETGAVINESCLRSSLDTTYVYLDTDERDRFAVGNFSQLITQLQVHTSSISGSSHRATLNFNHPTLELIWAVQRHCNANSNNTFNYSGYGSKDPIVSATLKINGLPRFDREAAYFRLVQPYQHHTNVPQGHIYCYSFALHPEDCQPSGSLNFSRIDSVELSLQLQSTLSTSNTGSDFVCYARNNNIVRFKEGLGGLLYSN